MVQHGGFLRKLYKKIRPRGARPEVRQEQAILRGGLAGLDAGIARSPSIRYAT